MNTSELRIGNFVYGTKEYEGAALPIIDILNEDHVNLKIGTNSSRYCKPTPIPLDENWLEKFGFDYHDDHWLCIDIPNGFLNISLKHKKITITNYLAEEIELFCFEEYFVHQIQNICFAFNQKELILS